MEFRLPDIGEGVTEGEIVNWLVAVGDSVEEDQPIVEVMTDKATVTITSPVAGQVKSINAAEGDSVEIGALLVVFDGAGSAAPAPAPAAPAPAPSPEPAPAPAPAPAANSGGGQVEFRLPDIGEGVTEGEIVNWLVAVGDSVEEDQPIVEVMTDKATVTITAPVSGTVLSIDAAEGASVEVGALMIVFSGGSGSAASAPSAPAPASAPSAPSASAAPAAGAPAAGPGDRPRVLATPSTRRKAREMGVDISQIKGTGPHGRITVEDVDRFAQSGASAAPQAAAPVASAPQSAAPAAAPKAAPAPISVPGAGDRDKAVKIKGIRKKISEAMSRSKSTAAHFSYVEEVDVTELYALRKELKPIAAEQDARLTYLPFIVKATVATLKNPKFEKFNAVIDDANDTLIVRGDYNIGIATDTNDGLVVPVLKEADRRSTIDIAKEISRLSGAARDRKLSLDDLRGGTFTITSAGSIGGLFATPIINYPEVAIMGVHKIKERPVIKNGEITKGYIMYLSLSLDHRIIDGADAAYFMNEVVAYLEDPKRLLLA